MKAGYSVRNEPWVVGILAADNREGWGVRAAEEKKTINQKKIVQ